MFLSLFRPEYKRTQLWDDPLIFLWEPRNGFDALVEIQNKDYRWSDELVNTLAFLADDWILEAENPDKPYALLGGKPFDAMQTVLVFGGHYKEAKWKFVSVVREHLENGTALTKREEVKKVTKKSTNPKKS